MQILTTHEFHAQGTSPGNVLAIAAVYARAKDYDTAAKLRNIAHEVAKVSGVPFAARPNKRKAGNDNRLAVRDKVGQKETGAYDAKHFNKAVRKARRAA